MAHPPPPFSPSGAPHGSPGPPPPPPCPVSPVTPHAAQYPAVSILEVYNLTARLCCKYSDMPHPSMLCNGLALWAWVQLLPPPTWPLLPGDC